MNIPVEGTEEWLGHLFKDAAQHIRAYDQLLYSHDLFKKLQENWNEFDDDVRSALFCAAVVHYARPFTANRTPSGEHRYRSRLLRNYPEVDPGMHAHLLDLRHKFVAHQDGAVIKTNVGHVWLNVHGTSARCAIQTFGIASALSGLGNQASCGPYLVHTNAVAKAVESLANAALAALNDAAQRYPHLQTENSKRAKLAESVPLPREGEAIRMPGVMGASELMSYAPDISGSTSSFQWRKTVVAYSIQGKLRWEGGELEISGTSQIAPSQE